MKKTIVSGAAAVLAFSAFASAHAQDEGVDDTAVETVEAEETSGAIVTRDDLVTEQQATDEEGNPLVDEDGNPVMESVTTGFVQTVETPSGNLHTITKEDGSRAIVTHEHAGPPEIAARAERAERPERPEKPERAEKPERPERPEHPGRPS